MPIRNCPGTWVNWTQRAALGRHMAAPGRAKHKFGSSCGSRERPQPSRNRHAAIDTLRRMRKIDACAACLFEYGCLAACFYTSPPPSLFRNPDSMTQWLNDSWLWTLQIFNQGYIHSQCTACSATLLELLYYTVLWDSIIRLHIHCTLHTSYALHNIQQRLCTAWSIRRIRIVNRVVIQRYNNTVAQWVVQWYTIKIHMCKIHQA